MDQKKLVKILKALANPRRLRIILLLKRHRNANVSFVAEKLDLSFRSTSKHLLKLEEAGLIERRQQSRDVFYQLSSELSDDVRGLFVRMSE